MPKKKKRPQRRSKGTHHVPRKPELGPEPEPESVRLARGLLERASDSAANAALQVDAETARRRALAKQVAEACGKASAESRAALKQALRSAREGDREVSELRRASLREARQRLPESHDLEAQLRDQIDRERRHRPKRSELRAMVARAGSRLEKIEAAISSTKSDIAAFKGQILEWRIWYEGQPSTSKDLAWARLLSHRNRLAKRLTARDKQRTALEARKLVALTRLESLRARLAAHETGLHERPIDEDPRMRGLRSARTEMRRVVRTLENELERDSERS